MPSSDAPKQGLALAASGLRLGYPGPKGVSVAIVSIDRLSVPAGAAIGIAGPSGSGKTSLLYLLSGVEQPNSGRVLWDGTDIAALPERTRDRWRLQHASFVFQDFHLIAGLSALDNVLVTCWFEGVRAPSDLAQRARELLAAVGLSDPGQRIEVLSRGEQQRVAIARALLRRPGVLFADEPTASLDPAAAARVRELLIDLVRAHGTTLLVVSHDDALLRSLDGRIMLEAGRLTTPASQVST
jgi:putative ABC transport system ATP-binding protein